MTPRLHESATKRLRTHRRVPEASVRPLFMWAPLRLEPNEVDNRHFEIPVSCAYPFVRILSKMRVNPEDTFGYEEKAIVPLWDACRGESASSSAIGNPRFQQGPQKGSQQVLK